MSLKPQLAVRGIMDFRPQVTGDILYLALKYLETRRWGFEWLNMLCLAVIALLKNSMFLSPRPPFPFGASIISLFLQQISLLSLELRHQN